MRRLRSNEQREAVSVRLNGAEPPYDLPTTANTAHALIPDDQLRHAKIHNGMLVDWGGSGYNGDTLPSSMDQKERKYFSKRYVHLKEEL